MPEVNPINKTNTKNTNYFINVITYCPNEDPNSLKKTIFEHITLRPLSKINSRKLN